MLNKSEVMMLIEQAGLDAQFRENSKNHWSDGVKKISEVPTYYQEPVVVVSNTHLRAHET